MQRIFLTAVLGAALLAAPHAVALQSSVPTAQAITRAAGTDFQNVQTSTQGGITTVTGTVQGAPFVVQIPQDWNGEALLYTHGYVTPDRNVQESFAREVAANFQGTAPLALSQGYAFAASGYAKTGYAVKSGIESTQALRELLGRLGADRAYLVGFSMGGNIIQGLVEKYPGSYAGALPLCGVMGGWHAQIGMLTDFRVVYDYYTKPLGAPFALPGAPTTPDPAFTQQAVQGSVGALFQRAAQDPNAAAIIRDIAVVTGTNPDPISFITMLAGNAYGLQDLLSTAGGFPYSNLTKRYAGSRDDRALNLGVRRTFADPKAVAYLNAWYTPTGQFDTKVLSVHNTIDPLVPFAHQALLAGATTKSNNRANLVQQVVDARPVNLANIAESGPAHCFFTPSQIVFAFGELKNWVENDVRPQDNLNITGR